MCADRLDSTAAPYRLIVKSGAAVDLGIFAAPFCIEQKGAPTLSSKTSAQAGPDAATSAMSVSHKIEVFTNVVINSPFSNQPLQRNATAR
jgi:hypothetical protein